MKQVIVMRKDLNMRKGKMIAQGAHASLGATLNAMGISHGNSIPNKTKTNDVNTWMSEGQTKICVSVNSERELTDVYQAACAAGIPCSLIRDAGHTEFKGVPTLTAVAIGPAEDSIINKITGDLSLL